MPTLKTDPELPSAPSTSRLYRLIPSLCTALMVFAPQLVKAQELTWHSMAGTSVNGDLVEMAERSVVLKVSGRPEPISVPLDRLTPQSQYQASELWFNRQDAKQFRMIRQHLQGMLERPGAVSRLLLEIHKVVPESPYAGIWAAAGISEGENDNTFAQRLLQQSIERIKQQQETLPSRHRITLASAYNNLGVVSLKVHGANQAAASLVNAIQTSSVVSPIIEHNAQLIAQGDTDEYSTLELAPRLRSDLMTALASANVNTTKPPLQDSLYYMLDFDLPLEAGAASRKIEGLESPSAYMELVSIGTGFVVAPGIVITSQRLINEEENMQSKLITVGNYESGLFKSLRCKSCLLTSPHLVATRTTAFHGNRSLAVDFMTDFRVVQPPPGSAAQSLMALHVPGLDAEPLCLADDTPQINQPLTLYGYEPGQQMISTGLQTYPGSVQTAPTRSGIQRVSHQTTNGTRGGPLLDDRKLVQGIVFGLPSNPLDGGGEAFGARIIRSWFNRHVRTASLKSAADVAGSEMSEPNQSIVPVFIWGRRESGGLFSEIADGTGPSESLMLKNTWCIECSGTAMRDCPACTGGKQSYKSREVVARTKLSGDIYGTVTKQKTCPTCSGAGKLKCKHCRNGRVN